MSQDRTFFVYLTQVANGGHHQLRLRGPGIDLVPIFLTLSVQIELLSSISIIEVSANIRHDRHSSSIRRPFPHNGIGLRNPGNPTAWKDTRTSRISNLC